MVAIEGVVLMPKGIPLTQVELEQRRREIAQAAVNLFVQSGFNETSMRQIAQAIGMGKSTLYDYFPSKDEIIIYVIEKNIADITRRAQAIIVQETNTAERLRKVMHTHLEFLLENKALFFRVSLEAQRLKVDSQERIQMHRYAYQDYLRSLIEAGIADGSFRAVDPVMVVKTLLSLMTPVVFTSRPSATPQEMLDTGLDVILNGLLP
jgi:AcrR family transcriptional regulator